MFYQAQSDRYECGMTYPRCGHSGLRLPAVSLGLWHNFGGVDAYENAKDMLFTAFDHGITYFDLANNYGPPPGSAETTFGQIMANDLKPYRDELVVATKAGYLMWPGPYGEWGSRKNLLASLDQSLTRMKLDYVDIFYSHRFDPETPLEETMGALATAVKSGKALYAGLSGYPVEAATKATQILQELGVPMLVHMHRFNMLQPEFGREVQPVAQDLGMGTVAFCPLAQGLLTGKYLNGVPQDSRAAGISPFLQQEQITPDLQNRLISLQHLAEQRDQSLAQMALSWILNQGVTSVLIGASRPSQITENVKAVDKVAFSPEELNTIEQLIRG